MKNLNKNLLNINTSLYIKVKLKILNLRRKIRNCEINRKCKFEEILMY